MRQRGHDLELRSEAFQSTHPLRGATDTGSAYEHRILISIHAPLAGCDSAHPSQGRQSEISIHAPLAGCDTRVKSTRSSSLFQSTHPLRGATHIPIQVNGEIGISIHAPLAGCDSLRLVFLPGSDYFNPRTPCGVRRDDKFVCRLFVRFQSTHPLRGATETICCVLVSFGISIHAPLAGCDAKASISYERRGISIHAPLAGCDCQFWFFIWYASQISIHAPLAGCDLRSSQYLL